MAAPSPSSLVLLGVLLLLGAGPAPSQDYKQAATREAAYGAPIPQEVAEGGLKVRFRLGRDGPFVVARRLNGHFDRIARTREVLFESESGPLIRRAAVKELGRYRDPRVLPALVDSLRDDNILVREQAAVELAAFPDPRAVRPLIDMLAYSDPVRAAVAARTLEKLTGQMNLGASYQAWDIWWEASKRYPR